jgi:hypothetical protein
MVSNMQYIEDDIDEIIKLALEFTISPADDENPDD